MPMGRPKAEFVLQPAEQPQLQSIERSRSVAGAAWLKFFQAGECSYRPTSESSHNRAMIDVDPEEIEWSAIRAQGAGGQNVNKVSTALHLRFDVRASSLPDEVKERLLKSRDQRISSEGVVIIKAQRYRSQERNREDAIARLHEIVEQAAAVMPERRPTRPSRASQRRRVDSKVRRGRIKAARGKLKDE